MSKCAHEYTCLFESSCLRSCGSVLLFMSVFSFKKEWKNEVLGELFVFH